MKLTQIDVKQFSELLAAKNMDVSGSIGNGQSVKIPPDTFNRTILIGLGGTGIQTINYVKRALKEKLSENWVNYVTFLGIDSDGYELTSAEQLTPEEYVSTTKDGVAERLRDENKFPSAWRKFLPYEEAVKVSNPNSNGSGQKRLVGKFKMHDCVMETGHAVDQEIVSKLTSRKNSMAPLPAAGLGQLMPPKYEVYVIGGICGGTGSGGFLEMPALVRKALGSTSDISIYAMLFLPDTLTGQPWCSPADVLNLQSNGYASLKELNYFQGMFMRPGYKEKWYYNDPSTPELEMDANTDFFQIPYLIGSAGGPSEKSLRIAQDTVAEFFISILGKMMPDGSGAFMVPSFVSNSLHNRALKHTFNGNPDKEAAETYHEFPKAYGALGFASAQVPQQIVKAYAVTTACERAGLRPVSAAERAEMAAKGETFLPFLGENDLMTAQAGTQKAQELLQPIMEFLRSYQTSEFSFLGKMQLQNVSFDDIRHNRYGSDLNNVVSTYVKQKSGQQMRDDLDQKLIAAFAKFRENVKTYVMKEGPMAFWNVYMGHFIPENNYEGVGIKRQLANLVEDKNPISAAANTWGTSDKAHEAVTRSYNAISSANVLNPFLQRQGMANEWLKCVDAWANISVNEKRREHVLGRFHAMEKKIAEPALILAEQVKAFGGILACMAEGYEGYSKNLDSYNDFCNAVSKPTEVNIAALNMGAYSWLRAEANRIADLISGIKIREALVNSFFDHTGDWLEIEEDQLVQKDNVVYLRNANHPVPARRMFDQCMKETVDFNMDVSIQTLFASISQTVSNDQFAQDIVGRLKMQSQFMFDGDIGANIHKYVVYPSNLSDAIKQAIQRNAVGYGTYESMYADSIMMYHFAAPFEIYHLRRLKDWEKQYMVRKDQNNHLMHGRSPDIRREVRADGTPVFSDNSTWIDYPSICPEPDPTRMREGGRPHEGEVRLKIDALLDEAKKLGVLYSEKTAEGWRYNRIYFDRYMEWRFDEFELDQDDLGLLPTGKALAAAVAKMNKCRIEDMTRVVELSAAGVMSAARSTEEWAWTYAKRVLYAHRPMLKEIREAVEMMRVWTAIVDAANGDAKWQLVPAKLIRIMQSHLIYKDSNEVWRNDDDGSIILNLSGQNLSRLRFQKPKEANLIEKGFGLYALHRVIKSKGDEDYLALVDNLLPKAQKTIEAFVDADLLTASFEQVDGQLTKECALVERLGGDISTMNAQQVSKFTREMEALGIQADMLEDLCNFYCSAKKWNLI